MTCAFGLAQNGEPGRDRTCDPLIKSQLLYRLSYGPALSLSYTFRRFKAIAE